MRKIVGIIKPFDMKQDLYVYEDGNKLEITETKMDGIYNTIFALVDKYNITQINLLGAKQYNKGLVKKIKEEEMKKYNTNKLIINII